MVTFLDLIQAQLNIRPWVQPSPLEHSRRLSQLLGGSVYLKLESFRELRSFKVRGAVNFMVSRLPECLEHGVVAASGGSHALGVAYAAAHLGVQATIVMTERAPANLQNIVASYGAKVEVSGQVYDDASARAKELAGITGARIIDSFNDPHIVAGQGTIALEIFSELPDADLIICPVGGGGLLAGVSLGSKTIAPACQIIGVEPEQANAMHRSLAAGHLVEVDHPASIADKLVTRHTGDLVFAIAQAHTDAVYCVTEAQIRQAVRLLLSEASLLAEGAGAAPLALLQSGPLDIEGKKVVLVVTGGNISPTVLQTILQES
jgi:threonine dehydratase